jgi:hypothetical protein
MSNRSALAEFGVSWTALIDATADWGAEVLRRHAAAMGDALDRQAMRDVEGARDWRSPTTTRRYHG